MRILIFDTGVPDCKPAAKLPRSGRDITLLAQENRTYKTKKERMEME